MDQYLNISQGNRFLSTLEIKKRLNLLSEDTMIRLIIFLLIKELFIDD